MRTRDAEQAITRATSGPSREVLDYEDAPLTPFHVRVALSCTGGYFSDGFRIGNHRPAIAAATRICI